MNQHEKRKLENQLMVEGLARLDDPELVQQLANLVTNFPGNQHEFLRDLINECEPAQRTEMYEAIAPKLGFKALSLAQYEAQTALKAGEMISQGRMRVEGEAPQPITVGGQQVAVVPREFSDLAMATLVCHLCNKVERFVEPTPAGAMIAARKAGWTRDKALNQEVCAECAAEEAAEEVVILSNSAKLVTHDRRRVN